MTHSWKLSALIAMTLSATGAQAAIKWNFGSNNFTATGDSIVATANAYANTRTAGSATNSLSTYGTIHTATLAGYGGNGLGIYNEDGVASSTSCRSTSTSTSGPDCGDVAPATPEHAMDNNQRLEAMLFSFNSAVQLTHVQIGWDLSGTRDSDLSVLRYTLGGSPTAGFANKTFNELLTNGWELVGNYANAALTYSAVDGMGPNPLQGTVNLNTAATESSSYWLVAAFLGGTGEKYGNEGKIVAPGLTDNDGPGSTAPKHDYVKVLALYGSKFNPPDEVPVPGSLALLGISLAGMRLVRRGK